MPSPPQPQSESQSEPAASTVEETNGQDTPAAWEVNISDFTGRAKKNKKRSGQLCYSVGIQVQ